MQPVLDAPSSSCHLVERLLRKNGGSTTRDTMLENERAGGWMYWGYSLGRVTPVFDELRRLASAGAGRLQS